MQIKEHSYSLIIPTRNRQRTAMYAIESALNCNYEKLQIVVPDNSDTDDLYHQLKDRGWLEKITYHKNEKILSMRDNWEKGIDLATGDILSVIGDDDAIMPDAYIYANVLFSRHSIDVLHSESAIYKWDCYPLHGRRHYIRTKLREAVRIINNPRDILRGVINHEYHVGTGPGLYYGFVRKTFLEELKKKRGRWLVDHVPDFDSGYATLMYSESFAIITRPLFVQGHSGKSNSGGMRVTAKKLDTYSKYHEDLNDKEQSLWLEKLNSIQSNIAAIVSAQHRIINEIRAVLKDKKAEINRPKAWKEIADGFKTDYDSLGLLTSSASLKKLADDWKTGIPPEQLSFQYPSQNKLSLLFEQGPKHIAKTQNRPAEKTAQTEKNEKHPELLINGQKANVRHIIDAIGLLQSIFTSPINAADKTLKEYAQARLYSQHQKMLEEVLTAIESGNHSIAEAILTSVLSEDSNNTDALKLMAINFEKTGNIEECPPLYARAFSLSLSLNDLEDYFRTLIVSNKPQIAIEQIQQLCESEPSLGLRKSMILLLQEATKKVIDSRSAADASSA